MTSIETQQDLNNAIAFLEQQQQVGKNLVKEHLNDLYTNIQPVNIIKNTMLAVKDNSEIKKDLIKMAIILAITYLSKKIITMFVNNSKKATVFTTIQLFLFKWILSNQILLKKIAVHFLKIIFGKTNQKYISN